MDLQDVTNLVIPEGEVREIHDKDNTLLWSKVNYSTTYNGDTTQQTYSGKNLFGGLTYAAKSYVDSWSLENNILTVTPSAVDRNPGITFTLGDSLPAGTYTLNSNNFISSSTQLRESASSMGGGANFNQFYSEVTRTTTATTPYVTFNWMATGSLDPFTVDLSTLQIVAGSTAGSYEPYVGGVPSPSPNYPEPVNVVTGEQTVTISDGTNTQTYTVDLGSTELCKIGTYQDYIYKSGDDWYVHKECGKVVLDGSNDEDWQNSSYSRIRTASTFGLRDTGSFNCFSNQLKNANTETVDNSFGIGGSAIYIKSLNKAPDVNSWKTWLSSNNLIIYGALATPTDTKITDSTLISQLNAVHQWLTRYGYNATVSGNLPIIIDRTNL